MTSSSDIILHHFDASPFSEKIRIIFGFKKIAWKSCLISRIMPRPDLMPLTGGYRRTPVMQIGADIFCDTQIIIRELERRLMLKSDVVICSSEKLRADKVRVNPNAHLVQHGVDLDHFAKAFDPATTVPDDLRGAPGPIIGFWGLIADWVDLQLIRHVADAFSGGTVVLLGNSTTDMKPLDGARNVRVLGRRHYADLPRYAKAFDVALMPFKVNELTLAANPLKVREYLAAGLPVVSTAIPEVERLGVCRIGKDADGVVREIAAAIAAGPGPSEVRAAQVRGEGWEARVAEMQEIVCAALVARKKAA